MKIVLKILFFIFTMIIMVGETKSSTVVNLSQEATAYLFQQTELSIVSFIFDNHYRNSCLKEEKVVTYNEQGRTISANAAKGGVQAGKNAFTVTEKGVALPKGAKIPSEFVQNPYRSSSYGVFENGKFVERLRIDQATLPGFKGPNQSHFHLNNGGHIFDPNKWPWWW